LNFVILLKRKHPPHVELPEFLCVLCDAYVWRNLDLEQRGTFN